VRVTKTPGTELLYSGGGYTVVQQLMMDATSSSFAALMKALVLEPLGMTHSNFLQPLPLELAASAATGHGTWGRAVAGRWHVYPELAAAGLWTTPSDLARFISPLSPGTVATLVLPRLPGTGAGIPGPDRFCAKPFEFS
jgi:CubicO group peptidase (beta-lactamase class C family)